MAEAYVRSQALKNWVLIDEHFDDPGYSASTVERPALRRLLSLVDAGGVDVVIWIAADTDLEGALSLRPSARRELVVKSAHTLVTACAAAGVSRLIVVTSAQVYGAAPDNPLPLPEGFPLNGARDAGIVGDLLAVAVSAGHTLHTAMGLVGAADSGPVGRGLSEVDAGFRRGRPLLDALADLPDRLGPEVRPLVATLTPTRARIFLPVVQVSHDPPVTGQELDRP